MALNINADDAVGAIAKAWKAHAVLSISDIPGVSIQSTVQAIITEKQIQHYIATKEITNGMIPKTENALNALKNGVGTVIIGTLRHNGDLTRMLQGKNGTSITIE